MDGDPVLTIEKSDVWVTIANAAGTFKTFGWTNQNGIDKGFWTNQQFSSNPIYITFPSNFAFDCWANFEASGQASEFFADSYVHGGGYGQIHGQYTSSANDILSSLLYSIENPAHAAVNIAAFLVVGLNQIYYSVTPTSVRWSADFQLFIKDSNGNPAIIQETTLSDQNPRQAQPISITVID